MLLISINLNNDENIDQVVYIQKYLQIIFLRIDVLLTSLPLRIHSGDPILVCIQQYKLAWAVLIQAW